MRMDYETYHLERVEDHILIVLMDRPEVRNAKNTQMGLEQKQIFESLYQDTEGVRVVILSGRGDKDVDEVRKLLAERETAAS